MSDRAASKGGPSAAKFVIRVSMALVDGVVNYLILNGVIVTDAYTHTGNDMILTLTVASTIGTLALFYVLKSAHAHRVG